MDSHDACLWNLFYNGYGFVIRNAAAYGCLIDAVLFIRLYTLKQRIVRAEDEEKGSGDKVGVGDEGGEKVESEMDGKTIEESRDSEKAE
jgi:hypothetical protein